MTNPLVSAIITTYNYGQYIEDAINSVLAQDYLPIEIIVINDGSTDDTHERIQKYQDKIIYRLTENQGVARSLNLGLEMSKGLFIGFLDADDLWRKNKINLQIEFFLKDESIDIIFGHLQCFYSSELSQLQRTTLICPTGKLPGVSKNTILARRSVFQKIGGFNEEHNTSDFIEWYDRVKDASICSVMLDEIVSDRRIHDQNLTLRNKEKTQNEILNILRARIKRQRT